MAQPRTAQQIADAAVKRRQTQAANRAAGVPTVRQQRAAAQAAKAATAGQPYVPPTPASSTSTAWGTSSSRRRRRARTTWNNSTATPKTGPVFATPKPTYRPLKLVALAAIEDAYAQRMRDKSSITDDDRRTFETYKKVKTLALSATASLEAQTEADSALRLATIQLVKLAF